VTLKDHVDDPTALRWITTCDPDIVAELLERQEDFPKTWNRAPERALTRLGELSYDVIFMPQPAARHDHGCDAARDKLWLLWVQTSTHNLLSFWLSCDCYLTCYQQAPEAYDA